MERLDKIIASALMVTRKDARGIILTCQVTVNGNVVRNIAMKVDPENDDIIVQGKEVCYKKFVYYMLNKPKGVLSASSDKSRKTVVDIVSEDIKREGLFPVGRLDKDTTGLLIITDDGDFGHKVISPKSMVEKEYIVTLDRPITVNEMEILGNGVTLSDGTVCRPAKVKCVSDDNMKISMVITEGKYHEIKRMLGVCNIGVNELKRIRIGNLCLDENLFPGQYREILSEEIKFVWN